MKSIGKLFFVLVAVFAGLNTVSAQNSLKDDKADKAAEIKGLIQKKDYVFEATNKGKMPLGYHKYDVAIDKDTLIANLPASSGKIKFDCTKYGYSEWRGKNGDWNIVIKPNTQMADVKQINMEITPQGHAMIEVKRSHGSPLALNGYVKQEDY
ncbi:MAG TPA: DUF4251 domain-containing protein [Mucilaginibacter sp.]|jgi:hypothetical protein|nr:DUF4251 domain-containing protein [Mucilaginibacter sp.]